MTLSVRLPETTVDVVPGRSTVLTVQVSNGGREPVRASVRVAGRASAWITAAEQTTAGAAGPVTTVAPGDTATFSLMVAPPRGSAVPGQLVPFTVLAVPADDQRAGARATGLVHLSTPVPVTTTLTPATTSATGPSHHSLELRTEEPSGVLVTLSGVSAGPGASVTLDPVAVRVDPAAPARAEVTVRPTRPAVLRTRRHPFEVVWETEAADGLARGTVAGRLDQRPHLPPGVTAVLALALLSGLALVAGALRPSDAGDPTTVPAASAGASTAAGGSTQPGPVAVLHAQHMDQDPAATRALAGDVARGVTVPAGLQVEVVDAATVPPGRDGFWLVVVTGFADTDEVDAFCSSRPAGTACRPAS